MLVLEAIEKCLNEAELNMIGQGEAADPELKEAIDLLNNYVINCKNPKVATHE